MKCSTEELSALLDGDLGGRSLRKRTAHLETCPRCRAELAGLSALRGALASERGQSVPGAEGGEGAGSFAALSARLGPMRPGKPAASRAYGVWAWAPALVLAVALGVRLGFIPFPFGARSGAHGFASSPATSDDQLIREAEAEFRSADREYLRAIDKLRSVTDGLRKSWPKERRERYDAAQAALAAAIAQCQTVARSHPGDPDAEELLFSAYQRQISGMESALLTRGQRP